VKDWDALVGAGVSAYEVADDGELPEQRHGRAPDRESLPPGRHQPRVRDLKLGEASPTCGAQPANSGEATICPGPGRSLGRGRSSPSRGGRSGQLLLLGERGRSATKGRLRPLKHVLREEDTEARVA
jgi:hypothetical protein